MSNQSLQDLPSLQDLVGMYDPKQKAEVAISSARARGTVLGHTLIYGIGGTGKTALAKALAQRSGGLYKGMEAAQAKTREHIQKWLIEGDKESRRYNRDLILFVDEVHRWSVELQEALYIPMKEWVVGTAIKAKSTVDQYRMKPFTLVAATTRLDLLDQGSFVTRFANVWEITRYERADIVSVLAREFDKMSVKCDVLNLVAIASRCLGIPRIAVSLAEKIRDQVLYDHPYLVKVTKDDVTRTFALEKIDDLGLGQSHRTYLRALAKDGKARGLGTLAAQLGQNKAVVEDTVEPILLSLGFIDATPKGRVITADGMKHLSSTTL